MDTNKFYYLLIVVFISSCGVLKQPGLQLDASQSVALRYSNTIDINDLKEYLKKLSSDEFEGRETTKEGQKKAAHFIKEQFIKANISSPIKDSNTYFQQFPVEVLDFSAVDLIINTSKLKFLDEYYSFGSPFNSSYTQLLLIKSKLLNNPIISEDNYNGKAVLIISDTSLENHQVSWRKQMNYASSKGAKAIIFQKPNYTKTDLRIKEQIMKPYMKMHGNNKPKTHIPVFVVDDAALQKSLKDSINTITFSTNTRRIKFSENVLGFIPGVSNEIIVISAHYDHIGYDNGQICNGADDDGSGTSALMAVAKSFQKAYDDGFIPQRGILFLAVSGEEKGLFGSRYYTENPIFPLSKTVADLNIDMVGRKDTLHVNNNYIYLIGSDRISKELHLISEEINKKHIFFNLDYTYNKKDDPNRFYQRSDHYNFAKNNIPVIFYFGGIHEDYHKPTDDYYKIDFFKLEKVTRYVFLTAWELAYRKERIK